jgi:serine protease Do
MLESYISGKRLPRSPPFFSKRIAMSDPFPSRSSGLFRGRLVGVLLLGTALGAGGAVLALSGPSFAASPPITVTNPNPQPGFAALVAKVKPAVVQITTISGGGAPSAEQRQQMQQMMPDMPGPFGDMLRRYFGGQGGMRMRMPEQRALGSGFVIDPAGYIVTNNHVVDGASQVSVQLGDGAKYRAKVVGRDDKTDLALLKIDVGHDLPYVAFGDSDQAHEGDWVVAVGNPYGLGGTVTAGIISAHGRNINEGPYDDFLQIDAPINPGNSGGPLFNQQGQVVGIDTAIYSPSGGSVGIGFAIPANVAKHIVAELRDKGKITRGWLGIAMQPLTPSLAKAVGLPNDHGILIDTVTEGSPASAAGLKQGDVITAFDGKPIVDARDLASDVADTAPGKTVPVKLWRDNHATTVNVTIRTQDQTGRQASNAAAQTGPRVGLMLQPLTPDLRDQAGLAANQGGVLVDQVTPGSPADDSGVQAGDVIERVGNKPVNTPAEVASAIHAAQAQKKEAVGLLVRRGGQASYLGLELS